MCIVAGYREVVLFSVVEIVGEFDGKGIVGSLVHCDLREVDQDIGYTGCSFKFDEDALAAPCLRHIEFLDVGAFATIVTGIRHEVVLVEGVRQVYYGVGFGDVDVRVNAPWCDGAFAVLPLGVEAGDLSCLCGSSCPNEEGSSEEELIRVTHRWGGVDYFISRVRLVQRIRSRQSHLVEEATERIWAGSPGWRSRCRRCCSR